MSTLLVPTADTASCLAAELEGRMEVMADDGLRGKPDYEDCEAITALLREQKTFPVTLELSDAQAQQAAITVENLRDWSVENVADFAAMTAHLKAQGYPR